MIDRMRQGGSPRAPLDYLEARLLLHDKQWFRASKALERARPLLRVGPC